MKKLALVIGTLICFAGCARNGTNNMSANEDTNNTAIGTPATSQTGTNETYGNNSSTFTSTNNMSRMDTNNTSSSASSLSNTNMNNSSATPGSSTRLQSDTNTLNRTQQGTAQGVSGDTTPQPQPQSSTK